MANAGGPAGPSGRNLQPFVVQWSLMIALVKRRSRQLLAVRTPRRTTSTDARVTESLYQLGLDSIEFPSTAVCVIDDR